MIENFEVIQTIFEEILRILNALWNDYQITKEYLNGALWKT